MVWFKVDDQLAVHMKAITAGNAAMGLWVRAGSWCMAQLTDGFVPAAMIAGLGATVDDASDLVAAGLWDDVNGGYLFHDWAEYQPTRTQVLAERAATRERVTKHRQKRASNAVTNGVGTTTPSPVPSPDYSKTPKSQSSSNRARVSTDSEAIPEMTARLAAQQGITSLRAVIDAVVKHTGRVIDGAGAYQLSLHVLGKAKTLPRVPQRYVTGAISRSPFEVQQFIDENALAVAS